MAISQEILDSHESLNDICEISHDQCVKYKESDYGGMFNFSDESRLYFYSNYGCTAYEIKDGQFKLTGEKKFL